MRGIASSNPTEGDLQLFSFTRISFKTFHGFAWFLKSKTIYIHRTYIHTSIIYVTKKVFHWGANHPTAYIFQESELQLFGGCQSSIKGQDGGMPSLLSTVQTPKTQLWSLWRDELHELQSLLQKMS